MSRHLSNAFENQTFPYSCGIAVIQTLLKHFGMSVPKRTYLHMIAGMDLTGTSADGVIKACEASGLKIEVLRVSPRESIEPWMTPAIALTQRPNGLGHYEAVLGVNGDMLDVSNPASSRQWTGREEFDSRWTRTLLKASVAHSQDRAIELLDCEPSYMSKIWLLAGKVRHSVYPLVFCTLVKLALLFLRIALLHQLLIVVARSHGHLEALERRQLYGLLVGISIAWIGSLSFHLRASAIVREAKLGIEFGIRSALLKGMMSSTQLGHGQPELMEAYRSDAPGAAQGIVGLISIIVKSVTALSLLAATALICPPTGGVLLVFIPVMGLIGYGLEKRARSSADEVCGAGRKFRTHLRKTLDARPDLVLDQSLGMVSEQLSAEHEEYYLFQLDLFGRRQTADSTNRLLCGAIGMLAFGVSVWAALEGHLWTGQIVILFLLIYHLVDTLGGMVPEARRTRKLRLHVERLSDLLDEPSGDDGYQPVEITKSIQLKSVKADRLRGRNSLNLTIPAKAFTTFVDRTGVRASVIRDLISMRIRMTGGVIEIDGVRRATLQHAFPSKTVSLISDRAFIQQATVLQNIQVGFNGVSREDAVAVSKAVGLDPIVGSLPNGYSQVLDPHDPKTLKLRRKLSLARAVLKGASLVIVDAMSAWKDKSVRELELRLIQEYWSDQTVIALVQSRNHAPEFPCIDLEHS